MVVLFSITDRKIVFFFGFQSFWDFLLCRAKLWGLVTYEQDWLNYQVTTLWRYVNQFK